MVTRARNSSLKARGSRSSIYPYDESNVDLPNRTPFPAGPSDVKPAPPFPAGPERHHAVPHGWPERCPSRPSPLRRAGFRRRQPDGDPDQRRTPSGL